MAFVSETTMALVGDGALLGPRRFDLGKSGSGVILLLLLLALGCSSGSLEDCGPDEECLRTAIGNCDSAKGKLRSVSEGYGLEFYVESRGRDGEDCVYYYKVVTAIGPTEPPEALAELRKQVGKDMVCEIPQEIIFEPEGIIVFPIKPPQGALLELCEGSYFDILTPSDVGS